MPRSKEYNREEVLEAATRLFWAKGFEGTSISELVEQTRLNKHSMYSEFGDKEGLFSACIEYYVTESNKAVLGILTKQPLGLHNIEKFFENRIEYAGTKDCKGCFLANTVTEKEVVGDAINEQVKVILSKHETLLYHCLKAAQDKGEIPAEKDCKLLARYLDCFNRGLMNVGKHQIEKKSLRSMTEVALSTIKH